VSSSPSLRASDAEREEVVTHLRAEAAAGRLTVDELDERCAQAYAARTVGELDALVADLPPPAAGVPARTERLSVSGYGARPFTYEWELDVSPRRAMSAALRHIAPALHRQGYELVVTRADRLVFRCAYRPGWTYALAVLVFPIGLVALAHKVEERITVDLDPLARGRTRVVAHGRAPRRVRKAFAELMA
jgi:hypothetical protein